MTKAFPLPSQRLRELGVQLPNPAQPAFDYIPVIRHANVLYTAGQLPKEEGEVRIVGRCGDSVDVETARRAARVCTVQALACAQQELGTIDDISQVIRLTGYVASTRDFHEQPHVLDAASELVGSVFGEAGRHVRTAVGVTSLPRNSPVEIEFAFAVVDQDSGRE